MDTTTPLNDGGPAFPVYAGSGQLAGMTLRDYYAGQALAGLCASRQGWTVARLVEAAYRLADAMLKPQP